MMSGLKMNTAFITILASAAVTANAFTVSTLAASFHSTEAAFVPASAALKNHQWRQYIKSPPSQQTRLAANGGMDAYEAQMAFMMSLNNQQPDASNVGITVQEQQTNDESTSSAASANSAPKWSGQNSYFAQLQQPQPHAAEGYFSDPYSQDAMSYTGATDAYAAQVEQQQQDISQSFSTDSNGMVDMYEAQYTDYLQSLQNDMEMESSLKSISVADSSGQVNDVGEVPYEQIVPAETSSSDAELIEEVGKMEDNFPRMASNEVQHKTFLMDGSGDTAMDEATSQQQGPESHFTTEELPNTEALEAEEENMEDKFLRMVSNEVQYKKLLNQSPYALTDIEWKVLIQRFMDNLEDSTQKNNGKFKGQSKLARQIKPKEERKTVVVLGTGWASHAFVKLASTYDLRIVVVSPVNHFVFTPMLASAAVGTVEYRSMTEPIRVTNPYIDNFVEGRAIGVDVENKKVQIQLTPLSTVTGAFKGVASTAPDRLEPEPVLTQIVYGEDGTIQRDKTQGAGGVIELNYDYLLCAVGTASRSSIVPGAKEHCINLKTSQDSKRLRTAIGEALEFASRPDVQEYYYPGEESKIMAREERRRRVRIAVVGGGPTGVELCGELCDFFRQICGAPDGAYQHLRDDVSVVLVHGGSELLPAMDVGLRQRALEALEAQGVEVRLNTRLKEVGQDYIVIGEKGSDDVETIPLAVKVWAAGNAPVPFVKELLSQLPAHAAGSGGRVNVDQWLRCPTHTKDSFGSILVLGDVACFESQSKYATSPEPLPQTAQVAGQQGAFVARMLNRGYDMEQSPPKLLKLSDSDGFSLLRVWLVARGLEEAPGFDFLSLGLLAYVGQEEALNQVMLGDVPIFNYSGKIAFALWRSVYLAKQASSRNQALIAFDWLRTETFGRDITRL